MTTKWAGLGEISTEVWKVLDLKFIYFALSNFYVTKTVVSFCVFDNFFTFLILLKL